MEQTLDRIKLLMEYNSLLTLTENMERSKKLLLNEQPIPLFLRTLRNTLSADRAFFNVLKTESSFFRKFKNIDEMLRELEKIQKGTSSIPTRDLIIAAKQISKNVPEFTIALEKQLVKSTKFKEVASIAYPNGASGSVNKKMRDKILMYYEQIGLNPSKVDDLLKRNSKIVGKVPKTGLSIISKGFIEAWNAPSIFKAIFNWNKYVPNTNSKGWRIFVRWLFTGTTRSTSSGFKEIYNVFVANGFSKELAKTLAVKVTSVGFEIMKRYIVLNGAIFVLNLILTYSMEAGTEEERKRREEEIGNLAIKDISDLWGKFDLDWVWPIGTIGPAIFTIVKGILKRDTPSEIYKKIKSNDLPEQNEIKNLENEIEKDNDNSKLENFVDNNIEKISSGEKGFKAFLLAKGKKYESGSFLPAEGEYPPFGKDTEGKAYEFIDGKWQ